MITKSFRLAFVRAIGICALGIAAAAILGSYAADKASADPPGVSFSIDAVPGGAVDSARGVPVGSSFSVTVLLDSYDGPDWQAYQASIDYDDEILDADAGLPSDWSDAPVADVSGGNLAVFPDNNICDPSPTSNSITSEDDNDDGNIVMSCASASNTGTTNYTGALVEMVFRCEEEGNASLELQDVNGTFVFGLDIVQLNDHTHDATISCGGDPVPTATGAAATATVPAATATAAPAGTVAPAPSAEATRPTGVTGPDTGTGHGSDGNTAFVALAVVVLITGLAGGALGFARVRNDADRS
jgi:hypothetical protein